MSKHFYAGWRNDIVDDEASLRYEERRRLEEEHRRQEEKSRLLESEHQIQRSDHDLNN